MARQTIIIARSRNEAEYLAHLHGLGPKERRYAHNHQRLRGVYDVDILLCDLAEQLFYFEYGDIVIPGEFIELDQMVDIARSRHASAKRKIRIVNETRRRILGLTLDPNDNLNLEIPF